MEHGFDSRRRYNDIPVNAPFAGMSAFICAVGLPFPNFFLKGGALLYAINQDKARPTKDIDFLGTHINNDRDYIKSIFAQIMDVPCEEDGIMFNKESIVIEDITQDKEYHGLRLTVLA